jgi:hypothetical protein
MDYSPLAIWRDNWGCVNVPPRAFPHLMPPQGSTSLQSLCRRTWAQRTAASTAWCGCGAQRCADLRGSTHPASTAPFGRPRHASTLRVHAPSRGLAGLCRSCPQIITETHSVSPTRPFRRLTCSILLAAHHPALRPQVLASNNEMVLLPNKEPVFGTKRKSQIQVRRFSKTTQAGLAPDSTQILLCRLCRRLLLESACFLPVLAMRATTASRLSF